MVMCFLVQLLKNKQYHAKAIIQHTVELTMYSHPSNVGPKFSPFLFYCIIVYVKQITTGKKSLRSSTACTILVNTTVGLNAFSGAFAEKTEICHRNQPACTPQLYADLRTLITLFPRVTHGFIVELKCTGDGEVPKTIVSWVPAVWALSMRDCAVRKRQQ